MEQNTDLIDLLHALNGANAKFLIVGAYAFAFHGRPRATKDVDIFVGSQIENARKVWDARTGNLWRSFRGVYWPQRVDRQ